MINMEYDCPPTKKRKMLPTQQANHSEYNDDPDLPLPNETIDTSLPCLDEPDSTVCSSNTSNPEVVVESKDDPDLLLPNESINTSLTCLDEPDSTVCSADTLNPEVVVKENDSFSDGKESPMEGSLNDHFDLVQDHYKNKDKNVMEVSKLDAPKNGGSQVSSEDKQILGSCGQNGDSHSRKKLLVLDVNGLLVDIVADPVEGYKPDTIIGSKAVFKRPFCDEFLKFCFERFSVGVWTSRTRRNIQRVLDFLMRDTRHQLLFCWDQSHCTETGFNTIDNSDKPLVLKELKKLWEKQDPNLPWDRGAYDESNTLFLDDSPYKALCNPPYTAIFPYSYSYRDTQDNGLGPEGDLRNYLEKLAASDNVQRFIEQNPFGQQPITYDNESWSFYHQIITQQEVGRLRSKKKLIIIDATGLLVDVASVPREGYRPDTMHGSRAVFKRPYCDEFLNFCFKRFNVGVWTSTSRFHIERLLDYLLRDQHKLLFCWDRTHCTDTGFYTVENNCKTLVLKELRKLWEKEDSNLPWDIGEYDESNTLLVDNAPYKALLNPPHTAIFPYSYRYWNTEDDSLGPDGDLRMYLEGLAACENVQKFVSENPFGQRPIREKNLSWGFYQKVIRAFSAKRKSNANGSVDIQCKNPSEQKVDTTTASVTQTLSEPKTDTATLAAPIVLEPKADGATLAAPTVLEPKGDTATLAAPTVLEPKADTATLVAPTLLEPRADTTTASFAETLLAPETDAAPTFLEPETNTHTALTTPKPETDTTTVLATPTLLEPETGTHTAQTSLEPEANTTPVLAAPNLLEPETNTHTAPTTLEPQTDTTSVAAAPTSLEPETNTSSISGPQLLSETESETAGSTAQTLIKFSIANNNPSSEPVNNGSSGK